MLQKKKAKYSALLTEKQFENVRIMSKELGKQQYYSVTLQVPQVFNPNFKIIVFGNPR